MRFSPAGERLLEVWVPGSRLTRLLTAVHLLVVSKAFLRHRLCQVPGDEPRGREAEAKSRPGTSASATVRPAPRRGRSCAGPPGSSPLPTAAVVSLLACASLSAGSFTCEVLGTRATWALPGTTEAQRREEPARPLVVVKGLIRSLA